MVFDNCQIDVFFHMRSHYSRLRNVQSVVDCSPPKALKRTSHSESSFQHDEMANFPKHSYGTKKHNCGYGQLTDLVTPNGHHPPSKTPSRPKTRRHPEDSPHCTPEKQSRSTGNKSSRPCSKYPLACIGYLQRTPKSKNKDVYMKNINLTARTLDDASCPSDRSSHPNTARNIRMDRAVKPPPGKSPHPCPLVHAEGGKVASTCTAPENYLLCSGGNPSLEDHEYLQFLLRITEDIIRNDLYSNKEMKKVFTNHVKANKDRLELNRMLLRIHELMKELNIPLGMDAEGNSSASWTDIETTMKGLLCLEKIKPQEEEECGTKHPPKEKCICFDLRATYPLMNPVNNPKGEETENIQEEGYIPTNTFQTSLDRLTEHTEPLSSRATCKISTVSAFEDVDILPGFECLETPKVSAAVLCELYSKPKSTNDISTTICHCHLVKKKLNTRKRKLKKRKKVKRTKKIDKAKQDNKAKSSKNNDTQYEKKYFPGETSSSKYNEKPIIITFQEPNNIRANGRDSYQRNPKNDYVLIKGPIYLLKAFLDENPQIIIGKEWAQNLNGLISPKVSLHVNDRNLIDEEANNPKPANIANNQKSIVCNDGINEDEKAEKSTEVEDNGEDIIKRYYDNLTSTQVKNDTEDVMKDKKSLSCNEDENIKEDMSEEERYNDNKIEEIRNILLELTNFPIYSLTSFEDEREQASHYFNMNDGCGRSEISLGTENNFLCKITCPNKYICEKLRLASSEMQNPKENEKKSLCDEYDLTPQKDIQKEENPKKGYLTPNMMQDFLTTREIQTEDIAHKPTIVGAALISQGQISDTDSEDNSEIEYSQPASNENVDPKKENIDQNHPPLDDHFAFEKEITEPKNYNLLLAAKQVDHLDDFYPILPHNQEIEGFTSDPKMPIVNSVQTTDTFATLASTATVKPTKPFQTIEEEMMRRNVSPLFPLYDPHDIAKDDSGELMHQRKVSILKNPIVQVPVDKVFSENDESKKKGESIIRAVEILKDRQTTRDPFLDKVLQEIEISRETRVPDRITSTEVSERSEHLALPGPSALKNTGKPSYFPSDDDDDQDNADSISYNELPFKISPVGQQDADIKTVEQSANTEVSSEAASSHNFDDPPELRGTASQIKQINRVNAKLDQFRHVTEKDETEVSENLDKLVETLKEQQEKEDDAQVKSDEPDNNKNNLSKRKKTFKCCGLCRRKKTATHIPIEEPPQSTFSEEDYKRKSEAFELALAGLGQNQKLPENKDQKKRDTKLSREDLERKMDDTFGPSPIVHSGNRLSLVRIADEKENDLKVLNDDFEDVSTKISNDKIKQPVPFH